MMGCLKEAEELLQNAVCFPSKSSNALINLGIIKQSTGDFKQAIKFYLSAYKKDRSNTKALGLWGNCLAMMGKTNEAIRKYEHAIKLNKEDGDVYLSWGALLIKKQEYSEAKEKLKLALKYNSKDARPLYMLAIVEIETGSYDTALEKLLKIVDSTENNFEALHNIAYIYFKKGDFESSISYAKKSLAIFRHKVETYLLLGDIYALQNKEKESLSFYEMAEMNNLRTFYLYLSWGTSLQRFGHYKKAIEKLKMAQTCLKKQQQNDDLDAIFGISYLRIGEIESSAHHANLALESNPNNYIANSVLGEIELINKNYESALKHLQICESDYENKGHNYMLKALCHEGLNECDKSKEFFEKAIEYDPKSKEIYIRYSEFLIRQNNLETAKKRLKTITDTMEDITLLNLYFKVLYSLAKQDGYKYNVEKAIETAELAEKIDSEGFQYKKEHEELKELLKNYE
jgi:tetratricopeptide (TPR) repeat protein